MASAETDLKPSVIQTVARLDPRARLIVAGARIARSIGAAQE